MQRDDERYIFADAAINIDIDAQTMAEIAIQSANTAKVFGIDLSCYVELQRRVQLRHQVDKVAEATLLAKTAAPELAIDELQFDT